MSSWRDAPETRYVDTGEGFVGYQVFGKGDLPVVFFSSPDSNVEAMWEHPAVRAYFDRLGRFSKIVYFSPRGAGASDPLPAAAAPTFDYWADDARHVMDAAGMERAAIIGDAEGVPMALLFAATHPERASALVLVNGYARFVRGDDYPIGMPDEAVAKVVEIVETTWGTPAYYSATIPSIPQDSDDLVWLAHYQRLAGSPNAYARTFEQYVRVDVRAALAAIDIPTLVMTRKDAQYHRPVFGEYIASHIEGARLVALPGADTAPFFLADPEPVLAEIEEFLTGVRPAPVSNRTLATVLFVDVVDSTGHAANLGDEGWLKLLDEFHRTTVGLLDRFRGRQVADTGDGFMATFDGPTRAVTCATQVCLAARDIGIDVRAGLHTGEIEHRGDNIAGLAVHIASRVADKVKVAGVTVSQTVADLVIGSGIEFEDLGTHELRGVPGEWRLHRVAESWYLPG